MRSFPKHILILTGEASGDMYGAMLAKALKKRDGNLSLSGIGGNAMAGAGVDLFAHISDLSVMGLTEIIGKLPMIWKIREKVKAVFTRTRPDLVILIDFPEFNLEIARLAKQRNLPVLYYISPKIWAWRQNRVHTIRRRVDHMAVIFPFETAFYRKHRVPVSFVGHPLLDRIPPPTEDDKMDRLPDAPVVGLLPGSREKEITALLPSLLEAAKRIQEAIPSTRFQVSRADSIDADRFSRILSHWRSLPNLDVVTGPVSRIFSQCHLVVAASGTVTLEAAIWGVPTVIVYKVSPLSYELGKRLIKVKHIGLANLIAGKTIAPELIQNEASPEKIADTVLSLIRHPDRLSAMRAALLRTRPLLGESGASDRVARIAISMVGEKALYRSKR